MKVIDSPQDFVVSTFILRLRKHNLEDYGTKMATCVSITYINCVVKFAEVVKPRYDCFAFLQKNLTSTLRYVTILSIHKFQIGTSDVLSIAYHIDT